MNPKAPPIKSWLRMVRQIVTRQGIQPPMGEQWTPASHASEQLELNIGLEWAETLAGTPKTRRRRSRA